MTKKSTIEIKTSQNLKILGIESSCDDTGVAIVTSNREILSNIVINQNKEHQIFQGVVPEIAARSHLQNLETALSHVLKESKLNLSDIDGFAATSGPGLIGGVLVGSMYARTLASSLKKPFIAVNHLEGHALTVRLTNNTPYPYLLLLASGGHSQFIAVEQLGKYKILGQTIDDSVGEAFDKVAKMLNLPFPGGSEIEKRAKLGDPHKYILPKPIVNQNNCNMSFSGLKTAVRLLIEKLERIKDQKINDIAASFQYTVGEILLVKIRHAIEFYEDFMRSDKDIYTISEKNTSSRADVSRRGDLMRLPRSLTLPRNDDVIKNLELKQKIFVMAGGVAANNYLRTLLKEQAEKLGYEFVVPPTKLCTDNAAMIAYSGLERLQNNLTSPLNFCPKAKWSLEDL